MRYFNRNAFVCLMRAQLVLILIIPSIAEAGSGGGGMGHVTKGIRFGWGGGSAPASPMLRAARKTLPPDDGKTYAPYFFVANKKGQSAAMPLISNKVDVQIAGVIADVKLEQTYKNKGDDPIEAVYLFPTSHKAAVHGMNMKVGNRVIDAQILERKKARHRYAGKNRQKSTASLLEQVRPNVFQINVTDIGPDETVKVTLQYTELITPRDGAWEFVMPTVVGPRYAGDVADNLDSGGVQYLPPGESITAKCKLSVSLVTSLPITSLTSPSHTLDVQNRREQNAEFSVSGAESFNRDFVLRYTIKGNDVSSGLLTYQGKDANYFLLNVEPPARKISKDTLPREYVFILDVSGSMNGFPLNTSKHLINRILNQLTPKDYFNVLLFAGGSQVLSAESVPATPGNIDNARKWIERTSGGGGTELLPALKRAFELPTPKDISRIMVVATDGFVTVESETFALVKKNIGAGNLFAFGIGQSVNRELIESLARAGSGEPFVVLNQEEALAQAAAFERYIGAPLLKNVEIAFEGFKAYDVAPAKLPDLFANRPLVLFGKYRGAAQGKVLLSGNTADGPYTSTHGIQAVAADKTSALKRLWARNKIQTLSDQERLYGGRAQRQKITLMGLEHKLMTKYTAFVVVEGKTQTGRKSDKTRIQPLPLPAGVPVTAVGPGTNNALGYGIFVPTPRATVIRTGSPRVSSGLNSRLVRKHARRQSSRLKGCYQKALDRNEHIGGRVMVRFLIGADGRTRGVKILGSDLNDSIAEKCISSRVRNWMFPPSSNRAEVEVVTPFLFATR